MEITEMHIEVVMYDSFEDEIFFAQLPISNIDLTLYNNWDNNLNDLKSMKYSGKVNNQAEGSILLGGL